MYYTVDEHVTLFLEDEKENKAALDKPSYMYTSTKLTCSYIQAYIQACHRNKERYKNV